MEIRVKSNLLTAWLVVMVGLAAGSATAGSGTGTIPAQLTARQTIDAHAQLALAADKLLDARGRGENLFLVDVRPKKEFDALHIPGAVNIPLHFIKAKPHLKGSSMVLVDKGLSLYRLAPACRQLREQGFDVRILDGGMHAWCSVGGPVVGQPVKQMEFARIAPAQFFVEKNDARCIVLDVSADRSAQSQRLMPYAVHLPLTDDADSADTRLKRLKHRAAAPLIVVNTSGEGYRKLSSVLSRAGFDTVFYLDGGITAYGTYLNAMARSWQPRDMRLVSKDPCRQCRDKE